MYKEIDYASKNEAQCSYKRGSEVTGAFGCLLGYDSSFNRYENHAMVISKENAPMEVDDMLEYVKFLNNAGFKISFEEDKKWYIFNFKREDYPKWSGFLAAFTALRYMFISMYNKQSCKIPQNALKLKNEYDSLIDEMEALQLSHYATLGAFNIDTLHQMIGKASILLSKEEVLEKMKNKPSVHRIFSGTDVNKDYRTLCDLMKKNPLECLKILKPSINEEQK